MSDTNTLTEGRALDRTRSSPTCSSICTTSSSAVARSGSPSTARPASTEGLDLEAIALAIAPDRSRARPRRPDGRALHARGHQPRPRAQLCARPAHFQRVDRQDGGAAAARHRRRRGRAQRAPPAGCAGRRRRAVGHDPARRCRRRPSASCPTTRSTGPRPCSSGARRPKPGKHAKRSEDRSARRPVANGATESQAAASRRTETQEVHRMSGLDMSEAVRMLANEKGISVDTLLQVLVDALATRLQAPSRRRRRGDGRGQPRHDGVHVHRLRHRRGRQLGQRARRHARRRKSSAASPPRPSAR